MILISVILFYLFLTPNIRCDYNILIFFTPYLFIIFTSVFLSPHIIIEYFFLNIFVFNIVIFNHFKYFDKDFYFYFYYYFYL